MPLLVLETERVRLAWSGPAAEAKGLLRVRPLRKGAVLRVEAERVVSEADAWTAPLALVEEQAYTVLLQSLTGQPVALVHRDPVVLGGLHSGDGGRVVHGRIGFGAMVGASAFVVTCGGVAEAAFEVEVLPSKADLARDVEPMRSEVETILAGLATEYLRATTTPAVPVPTRPSRVVWLTLLRAAVPALEAALGAVAHRPRFELARPETTVRAERLVRADAATRRFALAHGGSAALFAHPRLPARPAVTTLDMPAHRWLRARLDGARRRLARVRREEAGLLFPSPRRPVVLAELDAMDAALGRVLDLAPLREAAPERPPPHPPLALRRAPGYAEAFAALQTLETGLALAGGAERVPPRDVGALYELWVLLTLARTAADVLGVALPPGAFFHTSARGVHLRVGTGRRHALRLSDGRRTLDLVYNPRFEARPGLLAQRPDFLLSLSTPGRPPRRFVLDAKYRRDDTAAYARRHGAPGPPEDALGDLHRYRDAIVAPGASGIERPIEAAVALFPYREGIPASFGSSRLWTSVETIGVGAIPLLPGATGYLRTWLGGVLA